MEGIHWETNKKKCGFYPHGVFCLVELIMKLLNYTFDQWYEGELQGSMRVDYRVTQMNLGE